MHVIRSRAREYASHATVAGVISSALDLIWIGMCDVRDAMSLRNRIACMIAPALVRFARARALRSSLFVVAYNYFKSSCATLSSVRVRPGRGRGAGARRGRCQCHASMQPWPLRGMTHAPCGKDVVVTRGRRAGPS